jgi:Uma2 family endonuclease
MATTTNQLSWEAFERLPDDGLHHELIEGELQTLPPPKLRHGEIAHKLLFELKTAAERAGCRAFIEMGYKIAADPPSWIQPDISLIRAERIRQTDLDGYVLGAPELAVEVISPSESAVDVERKIELLLANGSLIIWVVYPTSRKVRVFLADGTEYQRGIHDSLTLPGILEDWSFPVAKLFDPQ